MRPRWAGGRLFLLTETKQQCEKRPRRVADKQAEGRRAAEEAGWRAQRNTDQTGWSKWQANETVGVIYTA